MLSEVYKRLEKADKKRQRANKINEDADSLEIYACNLFNRMINIEHIQELCNEVDNKGFDEEKKYIQSLLIKKQSEDLNIEDVRKYKYLDEKYGENLGYNKSFLDRLFDNMED